LPDEIVEHWRIEHGDVERFASLDLPLHGRVDLEADQDSVPARAFELRSQFADRRPRPVAAKYLDLRGLRRDCNRKQKNEGDA
jgi:hypothetical protein